MLSNHAGGYEMNYPAYSSLSMMMPQEQGPMYSARPTPRSGQTSSKRNHTDMVKTDIASTHRSPPGMPMLTRAREEREMFGSSLPPMLMGSPLSQDYISTGTKGSIYNNQRPGNFWPVYQSQSNQESSLSSIKDLMEQGQYFQACKAFHRSLDNLSYEDKPPVSSSYLSEVQLNYVTALIGHGSSHVALEILNKLLAETTDNKYKQEAYYLQGLIHELRNDKENALRSYRTAGALALDPFRGKITTAIESMNKQELKESPDIALSAMASLPNNNEPEKRSVNTMHPTELDADADEDAGMGMGMGMGMSMGMGMGVNVSMSMDDVSDEKQCEGYDLMKQQGFFPSISDVQRSNSQPSSNLFGPLVSDPNMSLFPTISSFQSTTDQCYRDVRDDADAVMRRFSESSNAIILSKLSGMPEKVLAESQQMNECLQLVNLKDQLGPAMEKHEVLLGDVANIEVEKDLGVVLKPDENKQFDRIKKFNRRALDFPSELKNDIEKNFNKITGCYELAKFCRVEKYARNFENFGPFSSLQSRLMEIFNSPDNDIDSLLNKFIDSLGISLYGPKSRLRCGLYSYGKRLSGH